jgi:hypothetical protein
MEFMGFYFFENLGNIISWASVLKSRVNSVASSPLNDLNSWKLRPEPVA